MHLSTTATLLLAASSLLPAAVYAQFNLGNYQLVHQMALSLPAADEASGVTYNHDTGHLYVVEDEGTRIYELDTAGNLISSMRLSGFQDVEGITYIGGGEFLLAEERLQDVFRFTYSPSGQISRNSLPGFSIGADTVNIGLEGISYDFSTGLLLGVKQSGPQLVYTAELDFPTMTGTVTSISPDLGLASFSDLQVLSSVGWLSDTPAQDHLLIISHASQQVVEIDRTGMQYSSLSLQGLSTSAEGITIDRNGVIYIVSEDPQLLVFAPVPEPSTYAGLMGVGVLGATFYYRRKRSSRTEVVRTFSFNQ